MKVIKKIINIILVAALILMVSASFIIGGIIIPDIARKFAVELDYQNVNLIHWAFQIIWSIPPCFFLAVFFWFDESLREIKKEIRNKQVEEK